LNALSDAGLPAPPAASDLPTIRLEPPGLERLAMSMGEPALRRQRESILRGVGATNLAANTVTVLNATGSSGTFVGSRNNVDALSSVSAPTPDIQDQVADLLSDKSTTSLLYQRPSYSGNDRLFFDLVAYAPGLNTGAADARAVIEAEAAPRKKSKAGDV